jgi:hypothetical protein
VFDDRGQRRVPRARSVLGVLLIAVVAVVVLSATAVWFLRRGPGTHTASQTSMPPIEEQQVAKQAVVPLAHPVPKFPAAHVDQVATPTRRAAISNRAADRAQANPAAASGQVNPGTGPVQENPATDDAQDPARNSAAAEQERRQLESVTRDVIDGLKAAGETRGLAAFPPPGTNPIKTGLVVPEGFELPKGYMRYYQTTDDGKRLEAILMFSPDYEFVDDSDKPIALPKDGIVPPEMAPPGLPLRTLEVPKAPRAADSGSRRPGG